MNAQEQRLRHTAVSELRDEVGTVVDAMLKSVGQQFEQERHARTKSLADDRSGWLALREAHGLLVMRVNELQAQLAVMSAWAESVDAWRQQTFWGRFRYLVTGR